jgi:hypothetical protein
LVLEIMRIRVAEAQPTNTPNTASAPTASRIGNSGETTKLLAQLVSVAKPMPGPRARCGRISGITTQTSGPQLNEKPILYTAKLTTATICPPVVCDRGVDMISPIATSAVAITPAPIISSGRRPVASTIRAVATLEITARSWRPLAVRIASLAPKPMLRRIVGA